MACGESSRGLQRATSRRTQERKRKVSSCLHRRNSPAHRCSSPKNFTSCSIGSRSGFALGAPHSAREKSARNSLRARRRTERRVVQGTDGRVGAERLKQTVDASLGRPRSTCVKTREILQMSHSEFLLLLGYFAAVIYSIFQVYSLGLLIEPFM